MIKTSDTSNNNTTTPEPTTASPLKDNIFADYLADIAVSVHQANTKTSSSSSCALSPIKPPNRLSFS